MHAAPTGHGGKGLHCVPYDDLRCALHATLLVQAHHHPASAGHRTALEQGANPRSRSRQVRRAQAERSQKGA